MGVCVGNVSNIKCIVIMHVFVNIVTSVMMWISGFERKIFTPSIGVQVFKIETCFIALKEMKKNSRRILP